MNQGVTSDTRVADSTTPPSTLCGSAPLVENPDATMMVLIGSPNASAQVFDAAADCAAAQQQP